MPDKTFQFKNPVKWENSFQLDTNTGMITMLRSIYLPKEINQFEIDFIVEDPTHRQFGKDAVTAKVNIFVAFCSFFPCSLTIFHKSRQQKSGGKQ